jgi:ABC-type transporter Mla subunit MlaD
MSLKITIEVTGQTEQQLAPVVSQFVARHPDLLGMGTQTRALGQNNAQDFYRDNSALLQQHIQELTAQNQRLQAQVTDSQRLIAGSPPAQANCQCSSRCNVPSR